MAEGDREHEEPEDAAVLQDAPGEAENADDHRGHEQNEIVDRLSRGLVLCEAGYHNSNANGAE